MKLFHIFTSLNAVMVYVADSLFQYRLFVSWEKNRDSRSQWLYGITNLVKISLNFQQNICRSRPATLLKKRRPCRYFSVIFTNFFSVAFCGIPLCDCFWKSNQIAMSFICCLMLHKFMLPVYKKCGSESEAATRGVL